MQSMHVERLQRAIKILKRAPKEKFNLCHWAELTEDEAHKMAEGDKVAINGCGTSGCAVGWVASHRSVIKEGLHLEFQGDFYNNSVVPVFTPSVGGERSEKFRAVCKYFQIQHHTAALLFDPYHYQEEELYDPAFVIERMQFLLDLGDEPTFGSITRGVLLGHGVN